MYYIDIQMAGEWSVFVECVNIHDGLASPMDLLEAHTLLQSYKERHFWPMRLREGKWEESQAWMRNRLLSIIAVPTEAD